MTSAERPNWDTCVQLPGIQRLVGLQACPRQRRRQASSCPSSPVSPSSPSSPLSPFRRAAAQRVYRAGEAIMYKPTAKAAPFLATVLDVNSEGDIRINISDEWIPVDVQAAVVRPARRPTPATASPSQANGRADARARMMLMRFVDDIAHMKPCACDRKPDAVDLRELGAAIGAGAGAVHSQAWFCCAAPRCMHCRIACPCEWLQRLRNHVEECGPEINGITGTGLSPLLAATRSGYYRIVVALLEFKARPLDSADSGRWTALHEAAKRGRAEICGALLRADVGLEPAHTSGPDEVIDRARFVERGCVDEEFISETFDAAADAPWVPADVTDQHKVVKVLNSEELSEVEVALDDEGVVALPEGARIGDVRLSYGDVLRQTDGITFAHGYILRDGRSPSFPASLEFIPRLQHRVAVAYFNIVNDFAMSGKTRLRLPVMSRSSFHVHGDATSSLLAITKQALSMSFAFLTYEQQRYVLGSKIELCVSDENDIDMVYAESIRRGSPPYADDSPVSPGSCSSGSAPQPPVSATVNFPCCSSGATPFHEAVAGGYYAIVENMIRYRADINVPQEDGTTPLMKAAERGDKSVCALLIKNGCYLCATPHKEHHRHETVTLPGCRYWCRDSSHEPLLNAKGASAVSLAQPRAREALRYHEVVRLLKLHGVK